MRKAQKKQAEEFVRLLGQAHEEIRRYMEAGEVSTARGLLAQCQEGAMELGGLIEKTEGEDHPVVRLLEGYCEALYQVHEELAGDEGPAGDTVPAEWVGGEPGISPGKVYKRLKKILIQIENSIRNEIKVRYEMAFLPYKASMWDSLESVWQAAEEDPDCDAYVVPIPYYDRNPDGSLGTYHYEGDMLPSYVPVTHYGRYRMEEREPDAVYIHNPYDDMNYVTSVDPAYYSWKVKEHTECLVYIPYYATSGGMSEAQESCPAYYHADYIVIQAEKFKKFFDKNIPEEKFLVLGSPKFDSVIHKCQNPPAPPEGWAEKMAGRKVYFYNTSLAGMLGNTEAFLKKMRYVFDIFKGREDACLLWRPHPLLESTFDSMRKEYKPWFERLRKEYIEEDFGIYDDTPDMESTIALSDVYIGDAGTSVTSLFGVAGKPLFIFNNMIDCLPEKDDWKGERISVAFDRLRNDRYQLTANNQIWFSEKNDYHYKFYMDLEIGYSGGGYYLGVHEIGDKLYVIPRNAKNLLIIENKVIRRIDFAVDIVQGGPFFLNYCYIKKYIFIFPFRYSFLLRFNIETEEICYIEGPKQFNVREVDGKWLSGGIGLYKNKLIFASPVDNRFMSMNIETLKTQMLCSNSISNIGTQKIIPNGDDLWLLPLNGMVITCWNPETGKTKEYDKLPVGFKSIKRPYDFECYERPFGSIFFLKEREKDYIVIGPYWGNMYVTLDKETGKIEKWESPISFMSKGKNPYFLSGGIGGFIITDKQSDRENCRIWYESERKLYDVNIKTKEFKEVEIDFDYKDLLAHEPGFMEESEWMQYCLKENVFNSLKNLLDKNITGNQFDRERQLRAFAKINVNTEGTCGKNIYEVIKDSITC